MRKGRLVFEGSDDKLVDPLVEGLSLLGTRLISGRTKMRRGRLRSGSLQPSRETCVQTSLTKVPLISACREAGSRESVFTKLCRTETLQETRGEKALVGGGNSTVQLNSPIWGKYYLDKD